jgi:hypothetical protein
MMGYAGQQEMVRPMLSATHLNNNKNNVYIIENRVKYKSYVGREWLGVQGIRVEGIGKNEEGQVKVSLEEKMMDMSSQPKSVYTPSCHSSFNLQWQTMKRSN